MPSEITKILDRTDARTMTAIRLRKAAGIVSNHGRRKGWHRSQSDWDRLHEAIRAFDRVWPTATETADQRSEREE